MVDLCCLCLVVGCLVDEDVDLFGVFVFIYGDLEPSFFFWVCCS